MNWHVPTWDAFVATLREYRDQEFHGRSIKAGENAYLAIFNELSQVPFAAREAHLDSLVHFLNVWNCHLNTTTSETRTALRGWLAGETKSLEALKTETLTATPTIAVATECDRLHQSLIALKTGEGPRIREMGIPAASKILHLMVPPLFVMWDNDIKKAGGWRGYGDFLLEMHDVALHLERIAPPEAGEDLEGHLQLFLGYPVRKPLSKYIDEYNWRAARDELMRRSRRATPVETL